MEYKLIPRQTCRVKVVSTSLFPARARPETFYGRLRCEILTGNDAGKHVWAYYADNSWMVPQHLPYLAEIWKANNKIFTAHIDIQVFPSVRHESEEPKTLNSTRLSPVEYSPAELGYGG